MEKDVVNASNELMTKDKIKRVLVESGICEGDVIIVHTRLSSIGWISGGEVALIDALMEVVKENGTIVMPAQSGNLSEPSYWENPPVPKEWWNDIRETMSPFDIVKTPTYGMGKTAETFRKYPNVVRSNHPTVSFTAWGKYAQQIVNNHSLSFAFSKESPLQQLQNLDAKIVMIGTTYETTTSLHYAEYTRTHSIAIKQGSPVQLDGKRMWITYEEIPFDTDLFNVIGEQFEKTEKVSKKMLGNAVLKVMSHRSLLNFAIKWYEENDKIG